MDNDVYDALVKLDTLLPLAERQAELSVPIRRAHRLLLACLAGKGRMPTAVELGEVLDGIPVNEAMLPLVESDLVVLGPDGKPAGAYPMTTLETPHHVRLPHAAVYAMCAIDSLAIAAMFEVETEVTSRCHVTGQPLVIHQRGQTVLDAQPDTIHTGVCWQAPHVCAADSLCLEMVFLRDRDGADAWRDRCEQPVSILDLAQSIEFAAAFFRPLVETEAPG